MATDRNPPGSATQTSAQFAKTHWSGVLAAGYATSPGSKEALERLCRTDVPLPPLIDLLRIEWPSGIVQEILNVSGRQLLTITEYQANTNGTPSLAASKSTPNAVQLSATGQTNLRYVFEASTNLSQWTKIAVRSNLTGTVEFTASATNAVPQWFYRVLVP